MAKLAIFPEDRYTLLSFSSSTTTNPGTTSTTNTDNNNNVQQQLRQNQQPARNKKNNKGDNTTTTTPLRSHHYSIMTAAERNIQSSLMLIDEPQQHHHHQQPIIKPETLPLVSICKGRGRRPTEVEVIYNNVQPTNVCQGCIDGNKFCYFEARGPKARLRRCTACVEKHLPCVMKTITKKRSNAIMPDPQGDLIVPLAFKNYFLQYRRAQYVVKHPSRFPIGPDGHDKVKEARDIVRRFRPVSLLTLKRHSSSISRRCSTTTTAAAATSTTITASTNSSETQNEDRKTGAITPSTIDSPISPTA